jgi:hypothetical protein
MNGDAIVAGSRSCLLQPGDRRPINWSIRLFCAFAILLCPTLLRSVAAQDPARRADGAMSVVASGDRWKNLEPGLDVGEFAAPNVASIGDSKITAVRIDLRYFKLDLFSAANLALPQSLAIDVWMSSYHLLAAINAGMFEGDGRTTTGYARIGTVKLNPNWKPAYKAFLAIDPDDPKLPTVAILDAECDNVKMLEPHYRIVLQSIRMVDCKGVNRWSQAQRAWSTAALAIDDKNRILFIHARSPWSVHDFIENLLALPSLGVRRAMYLEGGPEASLSLATTGNSFVRIGSWETGFNDNDDNQSQWALPNVLGVRHPRDAQH